MTLVAATADAFFADPVERPDEEVPTEVPRNHQGRPWIAPPGYTGVQAVEQKLATTWTRASKLGECLEDSFAIHRARERKIVFGLGRSQGLMDSAAAIADLDTQGAELDEIASRAAFLAGDGDAALSGTALHKLTERQDAGEDLAYLGPRLLAALTAWRRLMEPFVFHATETFVVNDDLETAGSFDRLAAPRDWLPPAPDGTKIGPDDRIGLDLKSGKSAKYFSAKYKVQQEVYFGPGATPYTHEAGRVDWPDGVRPHTGYALIPHVPLVAPEEARLYWVDLTEAHELAVRAVQVRCGYRDKGLPPLDIPAAGPASPRTELLAAIRGASSREELTRVFDAHAQVWTPFHTEVARVRVAELELSSSPVA